MTCKGTYQVNIITQFIYLGGLNLNSGNTTALIASDIDKNIHDNLTLVYSELYMQTTNGLPLS